MTSYVNPFGGYAQGYGQGLQQEDELQQNARRARQADWENKYLNPDKAETSHLDLREGLAKEPYYNMALNDASRESRAAANNAQLDTATRFAIALRDPSLLNAAGHTAIPSYTNQPTPQLLGGADYERNIGIANAQAQQAEREAMAGYYSGRNPTTVEAATIRANPAAGAPPGPVNRLFPQAPMAPATPSSIPAAPAAPSGTNELLNGGASDQGVNPQGSTMLPFHQLDPTHQAHILHYTSQLTGHPIEAVAQHIARQYNPAGDAQKPTTNFATA